MRQRPTARTLSRAGHAVAIGSVALVAGWTYHAMTSYESSFNDPHGYTVVFGAMFLALLVPLLAIGTFGYVRAWTKERSTTLELFDLGALLLGAVSLQSLIENATFLGGFDRAYLPLVAAVAGFLIVTVGSFAAMRRSVAHAR